MTTKNQAAQPKNSSPPASSGLLQRQCACGQHTVAGGECEECRKGREGILQRAAICQGKPDTVPDSVYTALQMPGQPLDSGVRQEMEPIFGEHLSRVKVHSGHGVSAAGLSVNHPGDDWEQNADHLANLVLSDTTTKVPVRRPLDFSRVRIHTGPQATRSAWDVNARAYTVGDDIVFNEGEYRPDTREGRRLLAHELTHVVQQAPHVAREAKGVDQCVRSYPEGQGQLTPKGYYRWETFRTDDSNESWAKRGVNDWITWRFGKSTPQAIRDIILRYTVTRFPANFAPKIGCQYHVRIEESHRAWIERMMGHVPAAQAAESREAAAGLEETVQSAPKVPGGEESSAAGASTADANPKSGDKNVEGKSTSSPVAEPPSGSEYEGGTTGPSANQPAFPAKITGLDLQPVGGTGAYSMDLDYSIAGELIFQMAEAFNLINYHWELYDITTLAKKGLSEKAAKERRQTALSKEAAADASGATGRQAERTAENLKEEMRTSEQGRLGLGTSPDASFGEKVTDIIASEINLSLMPASAIVSLGGVAIGALADLLGGTSQEREIAWPKREGFFLIRCIGQPSPRGREKQFRRAPSVATKIVEVRQIEKLAKEGQLLPEARIAEKELELIYAEKEAAPDKERIARLKQGLDDLRKGATGSAPDAIKIAIRKKDEEIQGLTGYRQYTAKQELEALNEQLKRAEKRQSEFMGWVYRPRATFVSEVTGETYPMLLQVGSVSLDGNVYTYRISDVTNRDGDTFDGNGSSPNAAVKSAVEKFARGNGYGKGYLAFRMSDDWDKTNGLLEVFVRNYPAGLALTRQRINDLVTVLVILGLFVPGVGEVAAVLGAAVAAERLIERAVKGTLRLDASSISDAIAILGAVAQGAQIIGRLRVVKAADQFVLAAEGADQAALKATAAELSAAAKTAKALELGNKIVGYGGFAWGSLVSLEELARLNQAELEGKISHAEARRKRAETLASLLRDGIITFAGPSIQKHFHGEPARKQAPAAEQQGKTPPATKQEPPAGKATDRPAADKSGADRPGGDKPASDRPAADKPVADKPTADQPGTAAKQASAASQGVGGPVKGNEKIVAKAATPDGMHHIFILEDGRIVRCSSPSCAYLETHYAEFLNKDRSDVSRKKQAENLRDRLDLLKADERAAPTKEAKEQVARDLAALEQEMRKLAASDLAVEMGAAEAQVAHLLDVLNPSDLRALRGKMGDASSSRLLSHPDVNLVRLFGQAYQLSNGDAVAQGELIHQFELHLKGGVPTSEQLKKGLIGLAELMKRFPGRISGDFIGRYVKAQRLDARPKDVEAELDLAIDVLEGKLPVEKGATVESIPEEKTEAGKPPRKVAEYRFTDPSGKKTLAEVKRANVTGELKVGKIGDLLHEALVQIISQSLRTGEKEGLVRVEAVDAAPSPLTPEQVFNKVIGELLAKTRTRDETSGGDVEKSGIDYVRWVQVRYRDASGKIQEPIFEVENGVIKAPPNYLQTPSSTPTPMPAPGSKN